MPNSRNHLKKIRNDERKSVFNERGNNAKQFFPDNGDNDNDQKIYEYMSLMYGNDEIYGRYFVDSFQLTYWILYSVATCHMTKQVSDFIPGSL